MFFFRASLGIAFIAISSPALAERDASLPTTLIVPANGVLEAQVAGQPARLLMLADAGSAPVLNSADAERFGIGTGWIGIAVKVFVGPVSVKGRTGVFRYRVGGIEAKRRGAWFERDIVTSYAGLVGPASVPHQVVDFQLRNPKPGEQSFTLPLVDRGQAGMGTLVGGLFVQFDPLRLRSLATAAAGSDLARAYQGRFTGAARQDAMRFGIIRPARVMQMERSLLVGKLAISSADVRTGDYGDSSSIPEAVTQDPDEIVVVGRKASNRERRTLLLGAEALQRCSSLVFDKFRSVIRLNCLSG